MAAPYTRVQGWAQQGGHTVTTSGVVSVETSEVEQSYPSATVTVFNAGTVTISTIYSDSAGTPKANPFTADANAYWFFYADDGKYDVQFSDGDPTVIGTPFTLSDVFVQTEATSAFPQATYITQIHDADLDNEQALEDLDTGLVIVENGTGELSSLEHGLEGQILSIVSGAPSWANSPCAEASAEDIVALTHTLEMPVEFVVDPDTVDHSANGTFTVEKATQAQKTVWAGPTSGAPAQPTFRLLEAADLPDPLPISDNTSSATIIYIMDGGGDVLTTGVKADLEIGFSCTIERVTLLADQSGDAVVDIWKDTYANFPPTDADSITAVAPPTISAGTKSQDSTLTGWTTTISDGDILRLNLDSVATITRLTVALKVIKDAS
jgi:hypothetical protein